MRCLLQLRLADRRRPIDSEAALGSCKESSVSVDADKEIPLPGRKSKLAGGLYTEVRQEPCEAQAKAHASMAGLVGCGYTLGGLFDEEGPGREPTEVQAKALQMHHSS